ncbi:IS21 family transposase [Acetivibrio ethanolgignens]|uniref:IS21 family transposase n=1 Tax=Acetivibrio ethanolgignens TaxID=290052 RepID=UPI003BFA6715
MRGVAFRKCLNKDKEERRMSTTMDQIHHIKDMFYQQDKNLSEIASETGLNWKAVKKYVDMEDFNSPPPIPTTSEIHKSKLDPFKTLIDKWLQTDKLAPRKQRHTAKRVFKCLKDEADDFDCSYRLVALYVKQKKEELRLKRTDGYIPLKHHPGEGQADFGTADFYENGKLHHEAKYLVLSFPFSNGGFLQLNYGENMECLLEGLVAIFEHIGGVPTEIWFDNTRTIVTKVIKGGGRDVTERFQRFCEHYEYSCGSKSQIRKFGNRSSGTRKSSFLCLITVPFLWEYLSRSCHICGVWQPLRIFP